MFWYLRWGELLIRITNYTFTIGCTVDDVQGVGEDVIAARSIKFSGASSFIGFKGLSLRYTVMIIPPAEKNSPNNTT